MNLAELFDMLLRPASGEMIWRQAVGLELAASKDHQSYSRDASRRVRAVETMPSKVVDQSRRFLTIFCPTREWDAPEQKCETSDSLIQKVTGQTRF